MEKRTTLSLLFFIRKTRLLKNGNAPVYMRITVKSKRVDIALNRSINLKIWSSIKGAAIGTSKEAQLLNSHIESIRTQLHQHVIYLREDKIPITAINIKKAYLGTSIEEEESVIKLFKKHNDDMQKLLDIDFSYETIKKYKTSLNHTQNYIKHKYKKDDLYLSELNYNFITGYEIYLKTVRNCSHNTTMKYIKNFRKIINIALANGYLDKDPFAKFKVSFKKIDKGFLSEDELNILINKNFKIKRLEQIRDCFIFSCFTGLAHSDLKRLTKENIVTGTDGGQWIKIKRKKTDNLSSIPILSVTQQIIDKYKNDIYCITKNVLLPVYSNQKTNAYLKEIAIICGINKYFSSHLARHTFATTITLNNNVPIETVSKMLGHSSISMTKTYAKLLDKKVGRDMKHLHEKFNLAI